jgi:FkbM family methyltransferase
MQTNQAFQRLIALGFQPKVIYDIGAHEGLWTREMRFMFPTSDFYLFEADTDKKAHLAGQRAFFEVFYSCDNKPIDYYKIKTEFTTGNSVYKELSNHFTDSNSYIEKRLTKTLSTLAKEEHLPYPNLLKLDTQGSELDILKGAMDMLAHVDIIYLETSLHQYNANAPLLYDILDFVKHFDFVLCDIGDYHIINGVCAQVDVFLCKKSSKFFKSNFYK